MSNTVVFFGAGGEGGVRDDYRRSVWDYCILYLTLYTAFMSPGLPGLVRRAACLTLWLTWSPWELLVMVYHRSRAMAVMVPVDTKMLVPENF
jgi:hypothetical protein